MSMAGIVFNSGMLIMHTNDLMRKGGSPAFRCSCEFPNLKGSHDDKLLSVFQ